MTNDLTLKSTNSIFERLKRTNKQKPEYWSARELAKTLEYSEYRHFLPVIEKAKEACVNSGQNIKDHFEDVLDMIELGKSATRQVRNILLSRYACYLIMQNADPGKEIVALGQTYFAIQNDSPRTPLRFARGIIFQYDLRSTFILLFLILNVVFNHLLIGSYR